jgi:hypothetical protein
LRVHPARFQWYAAGSVAAAGAKKLNRIPATSPDDIFKGVRYLLTGRQPEAAAILLVESGSRGILEKMTPPLRQSWGKGVRIDLVSCFATLPQGFPPETRLYRVADYRGGAGRGRLYRELQANGYSHVGIVCSAEPLMTKWKWMLAARLPAKVFVINENADYFWLDRMHWPTISSLVLLRTGLAGSGAVRILARLISFPFTFAYLLLYAATVHTRRALRRG